VKTKPTGSPETSVKFQQTLRNDQKELRLQLHRGGSLELTSGSFIGGESLDRLANVDCSATQYMELDLFKFNATVPSVLYAAGPEFKFPPEDQLCLKLAFSSVPPHKLGIVP
jgi:hypothetical protein